MIIKNQSCAARRAAPKKCVGAGACLVREQSFFLPAVGGHFVSRQSEKRFSRSLLPGRPPTAGTSHQSKAKTQGERSFRIQERPSPYHNPGRLPSFLSSSDSNRGTEECISSKSTIANALCNWS